MISSVLQGGLGNQMFQISAAISLAADLNTDSAFCINTHHLPLQGNKVNLYKDNIFRSIKLVEDNLFYLNLKKYFEPHFSFSKLPEDNNLLLNGYFQNEKYFINNEDYILNLFSEDEKTKNYIDKKYNHIDFNDSVSLHVRRGDYLKFPDTHPVCTKEYYDSSMKKINNYKNLLIFSDDIEWCKKNLLYDNVIYIESEKDYVDLYIFSRCRDNIISNSSFSWWGSWLNKNKNKIVIAPKNWFGKNGPSDFQDIYHRKIKWII